MKHLRILTSVLSPVIVLLAGCAQRTYYAPPPSFVQTAPPLVQQAESNGFRFGMDDGARDAYNGFGYRAKHDRAFHETPGYDPRFGPFDAYRNYFRSAYLRGYDRGFYRR